MTDASAWRLLPSNFSMVNNRYHSMAPSLPWVISKECSHAVPKNHDHLSSCIFGLLILSAFTAIVNLIISATDVPRIIVSGTKIIRQCFAQTNQSSHSHWWASKEPFSNKATRRLDFTDVVSFFSVLSAILQHLIINHFTNACYNFLKLYDATPSLLFFWHPLFYFVIRFWTVTICYHITPIAFTSKDLGKILITTSLPSYDEWLHDWIKQPLEASEKLRVPAEALKITTPLIVDNWHTMLMEYPNRLLVNFFISGIQVGFRVGFAPCGTWIKSAKRNLHCAVEHPES